MSLETLNSDCVPYSFLFVSVARIDSSDGITAILSMWKRTPIASCPERMSKLRTSGRWVVPLGALLWYVRLRLVFLP